MATTGAGGGRGLSNKVIAERLETTAATAATHLRSIYEKLRVDNRTALARQSILLN